MIIRSQIVALFVFFVSFMWLRGVSAEARFYIDINAPALKKIPIAIPDFKDRSPGGAELAKTLPRLLEYDLVFTGLFQSLDPESFLDNPGLTRDQIDFGKWRIIGAELLITGGFSIEEDVLTLKVCLFDTFGRFMILGRRYKCNIQDHRLIIHRFANDIIYYLTGERGVFLTKIAFISDTTGHKELFIMDVDGHNPHSVTRDGSIILSPNWSPSGTKIAYTSYRDGNPDLYIRDVGTGQVRKIADFPGLNISPRWGPSGRFLAATLSKDGNPDIYLLHTDGKILRRLTNYQGIDVSPTFSPDGRFMAFVSNRSGGRQIYVMEIDGGGVRRLTFDGKQNESPAWSPRGDVIAFAGMKGGRFDIYIIRPDGTNPKQLTSSAGDNESPSWSPDGRLIVFSSNREGKSSLYVMNSNGSNQRKIAALHGNQTNPCWSPRLKE